MKKKKRNKKIYRVLSYFERKGANNLANFPGVEELVRSAGISVTVSAAERWCRYHRVRLPILEQQCDQFFSPRLRKPVQSIEFGAKQQT